MAEEKQNLQDSFIAQHRGIFLLIFSFLVVLSFWIIAVFFFKPKLGQDALYLEALDLERGKTFLEIYDPAISFNIDLNGLPGQILRSRSIQPDSLKARVDIPSGRFHYVVSDIEVNRQDIFISSDGKICLEDDPDPFLTFQRYFRSDSSKKTSHIGFGWTHNLSYEIYAVGEVYTVIDWKNNYYTFTYDYREERFQQIHGLSSILVKEGEDLVWISPEKTQFVFAWNSRFSSYYLKQVKTYKGRVVHLEYDQETGKMISAVDASRSLELKFRYGQNGMISQVSLGTAMTVQYGYDDYGNLVSAKNITTKYEEVYKYEGFFNLHDLTKVQTPLKAVSLSYDSFGRVQAVFHPEREKALIDYDDILGIVRVTDLEGHVYKYVCEGKSTLKVLDPYQNENFFFYDTSGNIVKAVFSNGAYVVKKYNDYGQVIEQEDAPGVVTYFDYNAKTGILSKHVNPAGRMIKYEFNEQGLPVKKIGLGKKEEYQMEYDSLGRLTGLIDPADVTYSVQYDSWGNIQKVSSNSGWEIFYEFDIWGRQKTFVDTEGNRKEIFYDDQAQERKTVYPDGSVKIEKYNLAGQIIQEIWNKRVTAYQYDGMGRVVQIRDPGNRVASFEYDALGNLVRKKDFTDREYVYEYDAILRLTSEKAAGSDATTRYDYQKDFGSEQKLFSSYYTHKVYPDGETLTRKFDHFMRPLEIVETTGDKKEFSYDNLGNLIKVRKNEFQETVYSYDQAGNLESIFKPGNIIFLFEYNWRNQITAAADPEGHIYSYYYNDNGQLERVLNAEKQTSSFFYDSNGNLTAFQFPSGLTYRYGYDQMNRLAIISKGEDELTEITYDEYGQILSIAHSSGMFEIREHDLIGNLTSVTYPDESSIEYSYDSQGRRKAVKGADFSKTYDYDQESRLIKLTVNQLPFSFSYTKGGKISKISFPDLYIISYEYDTYGRVKDIQDSTGDKVVFKYDMGTRLQSLLYSNRVTETFGYNDRGLISRIRVSNYKEEKIFDADFDYNFMDVISEITSTEHQGEKQSNIYQDDSMLRVVQERADDKQNTYRYDVNGNLLEESTLFGTLKRGYADKNGNRLEKIYDSLYSGGTYVPLFGVMPKRPPEYVNVNNNVCQIDKEKNMFFLDKFKLNSGENVLDITAIDRIGYKESLKVKVFLDEQATVSLGYYPSGNIQYISKKGALSAFEWNDKNRLERIINDRREVTTFDYYEDGHLASIVDDYGDKTQYIYAPEGKLLAEVHGKNTISSKYVYAPDGRVLFKVEAGGKKFFYHLLPDGSIKVITDRFGNIAKQYSYDIFGNVTGETGRVKNNLLYKGMFFDDFSGMYFYGNRYYSPEYRIITGGGMDGVRFTENHLFPFSSLLGIPVLEMHPEEAVMPLKMLKKEIILHNEP